MAKRYARNPGTDQIQAWKRAIAQHNKQKRRNRWKRPSPAITGYVIMPPGPTAATGPDRPA
jgi:hypothetical protein